MDIEKLTNALNNNKYLVVGTDNIRYCFKNETLSITGLGLNMVHYKIYREGDTFFMTTTPPLYTEDLRFEINENDAFTLYGKDSGKDYLILRKDIFG